MPVPIDKKRMLWLFSLRGGLSRSLHFYDKRCGRISVSEDR